MIRIHARCLAVLLVGLSSLLSSGTHASPAPTKPPGGLDPSTTVGSVPLSTIQSQAAAALNPNTLPSAPVKGAPINTGAPLPYVAQPLAAKAAEWLSAGDYGALPTATADPFGHARAAAVTAGGGLLLLPSNGAAGWNLPSYGNPPNFNILALGPNVSADSLLGYGSGNWTAGMALATRLPADDSRGLSAMTIDANAPGSGSGTNDQTGLNVFVRKDGLTSNSAAIGGLGGASFSVTNGGPANSTPSDTYAINLFYQEAYAMGFGVLFEGKGQEMCQGSTGTVCFENDIQMGVEDSNTSNKAHIGMQMNADVGIHDEALNFNSSSQADPSPLIDGRWGDVIKITMRLRSTFELTDYGSWKSHYDGTLATQIECMGLADGSLGCTNYQGNSIFNLGQSGVLTVNADKPLGGVVTSRSGPFTLAQADCGSTIRDTATAVHTDTIPTGLMLGCKIDVVQAGLGGTITFAGGSGEALEQAGTGTLTHATIGQFSVASILIDSASTFLLRGQVQ